MSFYMEYLIFHFIPSIKIITPEKEDANFLCLYQTWKKVFKFILDNGVVCDWREPDIIRIAPHPFTIRMLKYLNL